MEIEQLRVIAGTVSSLMFVAGNLPMLIKAFATKDLGSYSLESIALSNSGNLIHWLYVSSLPFGPIWFLHGFFTITTALMLIWYLRFEKGWSLSILADGLNTLRNQGKDLGRQFGSLTQEHTWRTSTCDCRESDIAIEKHIPDYVTSCIWRLSLGLSRVLHRNAPVFREVYRGNGCFCRQSARTVW